MLVDGLMVEGTAASGKLLGLSEGDPVSVPGTASWVPEVEVARPFSDARVETAVAKVLDPFSKF